MRVKPVSLITLSILLLMSCSESKETKMQRFLMKGNLSAENKDYGQAQRYYEEALLLDSCFVDALDNLGTLRFKRKHYAEAIAYYSQALRCDPKRIETVMHRGNAYFLNGDFQASIGDAKTAIGLGDSVLSYGLLTINYIKLHYLDSALHTCTVAIERKKDDSGLLANLGSVLYYQGKLDSAELVLRTSLQFNADEASAVNTLGLIETKRGHFTQALSFFDQAITLDSENSYYHNNKGYAFLMMDSLLLGRESIDYSISLDPGNSWAYRNKGIYFLKKGDPLSAIRLLEQAQVLDATTDELPLYLGKAYVLAGDRNKGCAYLKEEKEHDRIAEGEYTSLCK